MKTAFLVFNVTKTAVDEDKGLLFGPGHLTNGGTYGNIALYQDLEAAQKNADNLARSGTAGVVFEMVEARIVKPTPVKVITVSVDRS